MTASPARNVLSPLCNKSNNWLSPGHVTKKRLGLGAATEFKKTVTVNKREDKENLPADTTLGKRARREENEEETSHLVCSENLGEGASRVVLAERKIITVKKNKKTENMAGHREAVKLARLNRRYTEYANGKIKVGCIPNQLFKIPENRKRVFTFSFASPVDSVLRARTNFSY